MITSNSLTDTKLIASLKSGGLAVIPTDTLYGIVACADDQAAVERLYAVRGRAPKKPCIVLVSSLSQVKELESWSTKQKLLAKKYWPGPMSLVVGASGAPEYLHRNTHTLAYRLPASKQLCELIDKTGPLIAPSANPEGAPPATTIKEAQKYFKDNVDFYVDGGKLLATAPSTVVRVDDEEVVVLRQGAIIVE